MSVGARLRRPFMTDKEFAVDLKGSMKPLEIIWQ